MALRVKIKPMARDIRLLVRQDLSPQKRSAAIAQVAREGFQDADGVNQRVLGRKVPSTVTVDGKSGALIESVNPDRGSIIFEWQLVFDVLRWIGRTLIERSPVVSGKYRAGHTLFADGKEVPIGQTLPSTDSADEYAFVNYVPYARKIEMGTTEAGRPFLVQVENRIYERTAKDAQRQFGNIAKIMFTYRGLIGRSSGAGTLVNPGKLPQRLRVRDTHGRFVATGAMAHNQAGNRWPAIVVQLPKGLV